LEGSSASKIRFKKKKGGEVPQYLKEDFPDRGIHEARIEARKLNEQKANSPTAVQYNQMLDYDIAFKGVPDYMKTWLHEGKTKKKSKKHLLMQQASHEKTKSFHLLQESGLFS